MRAAVFASVLLAAPACGGEDGAAGVDAMPDASIDAAPPGPCWPIDTATAGGSVELGTGYGAYRPMPDMVNVVYGIQGGYHFEVRARMRGMVPGDPTNASTPGNPRTRYQAFFVEDGKPINLSTCPFRLGYVAASDGDGFWSPDYIELRFDLDYQDAAIFNKQFRIVLEIIDANGLYAKTEKTVLALPPQPQ